MRFKAQILLLFICKITTLIVPELLFLT